jgi:cephalosporin hydroxylase
MSMPWPMPSYIKKIQQHPQELIEFQDFIRKAGIRSYLEIGSKYGGSLWAAAQAMTQGKIVCVDLPHGQWGRGDSENPLKECVKHLKKLGFDAHLFLGDSAKPEIIEAVRRLAPFDCTFIDANHTEPCVRKDFDSYGRLGRFCCFHDIGWNQPTPPNRMPIEVPKVWAEYKTAFADKARFREIKHDNGHNGIGILEWID